METTSDALISEPYHVHLTSSIMWGAALFLLLNSLATIFALKQGA